MGCCGGDREKGKTVTEEQKWDYITLSDFKSNSCGKMTSYIWLWFLSIVSVAVYAADTFTAVNLLAFNKWSSQIDPAVQMDITKWIFAGCILFSWVLCGYEWFRAIRVIRRGGVADSYLDPLAVVLQSERVYSGGQGWNRFLVFAELTKSKKGTDYIALFVYFQFKGAIRTLLAEGPRQVINALTLYSVMDSKLLVTGDHAQTDGHSSVQQFFVNIELLAEENDQQAVVLSTMLFTLVIWVFSALCLFIAIVLYLLFLWHYVPSTDGSLSNYCRRKVDKRLERIVGITMKKEIKRQEAKMRKEEQIAIKNGQRPNGPRMPTLPTLVTTVELKSEDYDLKRMNSASTSDTFSPLSNYSNSTLSRNNTMNTLPRKPLQKQPTLPLINEDMHRPSALRSDTQDSGWSDAGYASDAPLVIEASAMGYGAPPLSREESYGHGPPPRSFTPMGRPPTAQGHGTPGPGMRDGYGMPLRSNTGFSTGGPGLDHPPVGPGMMSSDGYGPPMRSNTGFGVDETSRQTPMGRPPLRQDSDGFRSGPHGPNNNTRSHTPAGLPPQNPGFAPFNRRGPRPGLEAYEMQHHPNHAPYCGDEGFNLGNHQQPLQRGATPVQPPPSHVGAQIIRAGSAAPSVGERQGGYKAFNPGQHAGPAANLDGTHSVSRVEASSRPIGHAGSPPRARGPGAHDRGPSVIELGPPRPGMLQKSQTAPVEAEAGRAWYLARGPPQGARLQRSRTVEEDAGDWRPMAYGFEER